MCIIDVCYVTTPIAVVVYGQTFIWDDRIESGNGVCASVSLAFVILSIYCWALYFGSLWANIIHTIGIGERLVAFFHFFPFQIMCMDLCIGVFVSRVFHHFYAIFFSVAARTLLRGIRDYMRMHVTVHLGNHMGHSQFVFVFLVFTIHELCGSL